MSISTNYSRLARVVTHIQNPNLPTGTLIEEIPADIGRSVEGYKRGGMLEGVEKFRKEVFSAIVWLLGIPAFKYVGDKLSEHLLKVPMAIDFCKESEGNNSLKESVEFLTQGLNPKNLDTKELVKKYGNKFRITDPKILNDPALLKAHTDEMIKKIKGAKKLNSILAVGLNCFAMGVVLPKLAQKMTAKKIKEMNEAKAKETKHIETLDEFINKSKKDANSIVAFQGRIPKDLNDVVYNVENDNVFRLIITDIPMIIGRMATSRNKYEALEYLLMDGSGIYLYNYAAKHVQKLLRKVLPTPDVNPQIAEKISKMTADQLTEAIKQVEGGKKDIMGIFNGQQAESIKEIYSIGTFGKYGKINKFVKNSDLNEIDQSVVGLLKFIKSKFGSVITDDKIENIKKSISGINKKNASFLFAGLGVSTLGLSVVVPKLTFWVTRKLTGRNEFTGIADYSQDKKS